MSLSLGSARIPEEIELRARRVRRPGRAVAQAARILLVILLLVGPWVDGRAEGPAPVEIAIESPAKGEVIRNRVTVAPVRGQARSGSDAPKDFDVMIAIDVSHSTRYPSGIDVDEDGETGLNPEQELVPAGTYPEGMVCSDPQDTILAAEVRAARQLLSVLDPKLTRVGVLVFSGAVDPLTGERVRSDQRDALLKVPLTNHFDVVSKGLDQILEEGSYGATNFAAAIQLGVVELSGLSRSYSDPRPGARKVILFLTDGVPTFPYGKATMPDPEDTEAALAAARLAKAAAVTVNAFAIGQQALVSPLALTEIASITLGTFTPVRDPGDIVDFLSGVSFANISDIVVTNLTTGEITFDVELLPDGSFSAFVPVREGINQVEVAALASDGGEKRVRVALEFEKSGLTPRELAIELERVKKRNQALMRLLEQRRIEAFRERQRKRVEVEAEETKVD